MRYVFITFPLIALTGCASIVEGRHQSITINTNPSQATCNYTRGGVQIGQVTSTPGSVIVSKRAEDVVIKCSKPGYQDASVTDEHDVAGWLFGNLIFGGLIGLVVDVADGSANKYDSDVTVDLPQKTATVPPQQSGAPTS